MVNPNQPPDKRLCLGHSVTATENGPKCGEPWKREGTMAPGIDTVLGQMRRRSEQRTLGREMREGM